MCFNSYNRRCFADVYISSIPNSLSFKEVFPKERDDEIRSVTNERVKIEKYSAWILLEYALISSLGLNIRDAKLYKDENGKWRSPIFELSISHCNDVVAVIISHAPVGIDVEPMDKVISQGFAERFLTPDEFSQYSLVSDNKKAEFLLARWCMKEAIFKKIGGKAFAPSKISSFEESAIEKRFSIAKKEYLVAVSSESKSDVSFSFFTFEDMHVFFDSKYS